MVLAARPPAFKGHGAPSTASRGRPSVGPHDAVRPQQCSGAASLQRKSSMDTGLQRQFSGSCTLGLQKRPSSGTAHALGTVAEAADAASYQGLLSILTDPGAASASFDEVCEVLGDVAKLDSVSAAFSASSLSAGQHALRGLFGSNAALSWLLEKLTQNLHQLLGLSLLEGLIDKSLIDLFQQLYGVLDLSGDIGSVPALRLGVAAAIALLVQQLVLRYQAEHPAKLERQMSPAASLSDALAEAAAAALIAESVKQQQDTSPVRDQQQQQQQRQWLQPALAAAAAPGSSGSSAFSSVFACCTAAIPAATGNAVGGSSSHGSSIRSGKPPSSFKAITSSLLQQQGLTMSNKAHIVVRSLLVSLLLGQFKRGNKLKRKVRSSLDEMLQGHWSPALLLVLIEGGVLMHNYSELVSGLKTLLHIGS